jgi:hypothetical protein
VIEAHPRRRGASIDQRHRPVVGHEKKEQRQDEAGNADDAKGGLPAPARANDAAEHGAGNRPDRSGGKEPAEHGGAKPRPEEARQQCAARRAVERIQADRK